MSSPTYKAVLTAADFDELLQIPFLRDILVLAHVMNTLRSSQRFMLLSDGYPEGPTKTRDTVFGLLSTVSFVYAGIERAAGILNQLAITLPNLRNEIAWVIDQQRKPDSLLNTTLKKIRDQIVFHFHLQIGDEVLKNAVKGFPVLFAEGSSSRTVDWSYTLADEVITQLLAIYDSSSGTPKEKVANLVRQLGEYNVRFCEVLDRVIAELVGNHATPVLGTDYT